MQRNFAIKKCNISYYARGRSKQIFHDFTYHSTSYTEKFSVADEQGGKLKNRCVFLCDEYGTLPKIESAEMMFSASRSRRLQIVAIIQSLQQLEKNYGKEGAAIIVDNTQLTIFGGFAPNSVLLPSQCQRLLAAGLL